MCQRFSLGIRRHSLESKPLSMCLNIFGGAAATSRDISGPGTDFSRPCRTEPIPRPTSSVAAHAVVQVPRSIRLRLTPGSPGRGGKGQLEEARAEWRHTGQFLCCARACSLQERVRSGGAGAPRCRTTPSSYCRRSRGRLAVAAADCLL